MFVYCLHCQTNRCRQIAALLEKLGAKRAFSPQIISCQRVAGNIENALYDLLPGYVFVYFNEPLIDFEIFTKIAGINRCLGLDEYGKAGLQNHDYAFAMDLYQKDGVIGSITVIKKDGEVFLREPVFKGHKASIVSVDHRKKRVKLCFSFDEKSWYIWVVCNVIYKDDNQQNKRIELISHEIVKREKCGVYTEYKP